MFLIVFNCSLRSLPDNSAATPVAPAPSEITFSHSTNLRIAKAMFPSLTVIVLSIKLLAVSNALHPTKGTAKPSASDGLAGV